MKMANYAKYTKGAMGHMTKHYERGKDSDGQYVKFSNQEIDTTRSYMNYNLAPQHNQLDFIHERLKDVYCLNRKDVNVMCSWVVTAPKDLEKGMEERFFKETYKFLEEKYDKKNVVSAFVHTDEVTPHMHFCFVPVVYDEKKKREKVSAKECVTRSDLQQFHEQLQTHLSERGIKCTIINDATLEGNKAIQELKRGTAVEKLTEVLQEVQTVEEHIVQLEDERNSLKGEIKDLEGRVLSLQEVNQVKIKKPLLGGEKAFIKMRYQDAINLQKTAQRVDGVDRLVKELNVKLELVKNIKAEADKTYDNARRLPLKTQDEILTLRMRVDKAESRANKVLSDVNKALERCSPDVRERFVRAYDEVGKEQSQSRNRGFGRER